jgi:hypothetical protein
LAVLVYGRPAAAHLPVLQGKLVDLARRSDLVVVGRVKNVAQINSRVVDTVIEVNGLLVGESAPEVRFRGRTRFAPGEHYVFFLKSNDDAIEGLQPSGTLFPIGSPQEEEGYRSVVIGIRNSPADESKPSPALRAALIAALSAPAKELRYHAALELSAIAHHIDKLDPAERANLEALASNPATDPVLLSLLHELLHAGSESAVPSGKFAPTP